MKKITEIIRLIKNKKRKKRNKKRNKKWTKMKKKNMKQHDKKKEKNEKKKKKTSSFPVKRPQLGRILRIFRLRMRTSKGTPKGSSDLR
jgi:hypothetical protein